MLQGLGISPTGTSISAGSPEASALRKADRRNSGVVTRWPMMPKLSASFMKSGLRKSLPMTRFP
jgi:hypothetical protein